jgi:hypothetical protein
MEFNELSVQLDFGHLEKDSEFNKLSNLREYNPLPRTKIINDPLHGHIDFSKGILLKTKSFKTL